MVAGVASVLLSLAAQSLPQAYGQPPLYIAVAGVGGAMSTLTIAYADDPGLEQARQDVQALAQTGQWSISVPQRATTEEGVLYEAQITPAVTLDASGQVPVFPFLAAFRRLPQIRFGFVGESVGAPGEFHDENRYVAARWTRAGRSVTFDFQIKDPSFQTAEDVRLVDRPADQPLPTPASTGPSGPPTAPLWALLVVGALGTGVFVWGLTWWLLTVRAARSAETKEEKASPEAKDAPAEASGDSEATQPEPNDSSGTPTREP